MFKRLIKKFKIAYIRALGTDSTSLRQLIAQSVHQQVCRHPQLWSCNYIKDVFGEKALDWYKEELSSYVISCYPQMDTKNYTQVPFSYISQLTKQLPSVERLEFTKYLVKKYT